MKVRRIAFSGVLLALLAPSGFAAQNLDQARAAGLWPYLVACFGGGLFALLTPCVFPMIPVTVSYFTKRKDAKPLAAALSYSLGIISTFAIVGIGVALIFGSAGIQNFATNPWTNLALGILFIVLALNLFGLYEIQVPLALQNRMLKASGSGGLAGPYFMGVTFALTTFTCTTAIVAGLLAQAAHSQGSVLEPVLGMLSFGLAFAAPFFLLALFPSALAKTPRGGEWLGAVKPALGFIELAAAMKFISNADLVWVLGLITRPVFLASWALIAALLGAYLFGLPKMIAKTGWARRSLGLVSLLLCGYMLSGFRSGASVGAIEAFLPPDPYPARNAGISTKEETANLEAKTFDEAEALAKKTGKLVFIDFTGVTCVNCRWMEKNIFPKPEVASELKKLVKVQLYTDRGTSPDNANQALLTKFTGSVAMPSYVLVDGDGKIVAKFAGATKDPIEFATFLKKTN